MNKYPDQYTRPEVLTFDSGVAGPVLTVLGAVHGDEFCGPQALFRLRDMLEDGCVHVTSGKLVVIPVANPLAYEKRVRFVDRNLNRFMYPKDDLRHYEDHLDLVLCPVLDQTDYLLDLHSYHSKGEAFIFLGKRDAENIAFARALGVPRLIYGWADAMTASDDVIDKKQAMGTTEYAREQGAVAVTLECGYHQHPRAADVGFHATLKALSYLNMADHASSFFLQNLPSAAAYDIKMGGAVIKLKEGRFLQPWENMTFVQKETPLAEYDDGERVVMPRDGFLILPHQETIIGEPWLFWGTEGTL